MSNKKWVVSLAAAALAASVLAGCGSPATVNNTPRASTNTVAASLPSEPTYSGPVAATYQGGKLTKAELDHQYNLQIVLLGLEKKQTKKVFLDNYVVLYKYLYGQAKQQVKTPVSAAQAQQLADQALQQLAKSPYKSTQEVDAKMKSLGLTKNDLVLWADKELLLQDYLNSKIQVSAAQAKAYYNQHKSDFTQVTVDQILVSTRTEAQKVEQQLKGGTKFADLADKVSIDPSAKQNHGHFANALVSEFVPAFAQACLTLPIGQISNPVHTQYGYHILRVDARKQMPYADVQTQVKQQMLPQVQQQQVKAIYNQALKDAKIKVVSSNL